MKRRIANFLIKLILKADSKYRILLYKTLRSDLFLEQKQLYLKKYSISPDFGFNGQHINFYGDGIIEIGEESYIGDYSTIQSVDGCSVMIGNYCAISHNVRIYTLTYDSNGNFNKSGEKTTKQGDVIIGSGVWIGANVLINPGVSIGDNAVIGANSVVTKDIMKNTINGGVPAKKIRTKLFS